MQSKLLRHSIFLLSCFFITTISFAQLANVGISGTLHMYGGDGGVANHPFRINLGSNDGQRFRVGENGKVTIGIPQADWDGNYKNWDASYKFFVNGKSYLMDGLQFSNTLASKLTFFKSAPSGTTYISGIGTTGNQTTGQVQLNYTIPNVTGSAHVFYKGGENAAGGTELMRITGAGQLGIGVTSPEKGLDLRGDALFRLGTDAAGHPIELEFEDITNGTNGYGEGTWIGTRSNHKLIFGTNDKLNMALDVNGNLGIGNGAPFAKLTVNGDLGFGSSTGSSVGNKITLWNNGALISYGFGIAGGKLAYRVADNTAAHVFYAGGTNADGTELMRITGNGNLGIGNDAPDSKLTINGDLGFASKTGSTIGNKITLYKTGATTSYGIGIDAGKLAYRVAAAADAHVFYAGGANADGTELMRITGNGDVGIGTNNPLSPLHVMGNGRFTVGEDDDDIAIEAVIKSSTTSGGINTGAWMGTLSKHNLYIGTNGSAGIAIDDNTQYVGIGINTPENRLHVKGSLAVGDGYYSKCVISSVLENDEVLGSVIGTTTETNFYLKASDNYALGIDPKGSVFIGFDKSLTPLSTQTTNNYNLFVNKGVLSEDFALAPVDEWADHVFGKNYKLKPLSEVEQFINANQHLPGIPSAEEVKKDGYSVKDINVKFLEKIEELTLYTIGQGKEIDALKKQLQQYEHLAAEVEKLKQSISQK